MIFKVQVLRISNMTYQLIYKSFSFWTSREFIHKLIDVSDHDYLKDHLSQIEYLRKCLQAGLNVIYLIVQEYIY